MSFQVGQKVSVKGNIGTVRYFGPTEFSTGQWVGIELEGSSGKNDGSVAGVRYFNCEIEGDCGVFVRPTVPQKVDDDNNMIIEKDSRLMPPPSHSQKRRTISGPEIFSDMSKPFSRPSSRSSETALQRARSRPTSRVSDLLARTRPSSRVSDDVPRVRPSSRINDDLPRTRPSSRINDDTLRVRPRSSRDIASGAVVRVRSTSSNELSSDAITRSISPNNEVSELVLRRRSRISDIYTPGQFNDTIPESQVSSRRHSRKSSRVSDIFPVGYRPIDSDVTSPDSSRLHIIITRLQEKLKKANTDIEEFQKQLESLKLENKSLVDSTADHEESLEIFTVDKEVLEESNHALKESLDSLQRQYEDLQNDYTSLQEEIQLDLELENELINNDDIETLHKRNKKLENALIKLEQLSSGKEISLSEEIVALQAQIDGFSKLQNDYTEVSLKLTNAENLIRDLQETLESSLDSEKMIENLTEKNLSLNESVVQLQKTVAELEQLQELDKDLEETHLGIENELRNDIKALETIINDDRMFIEEMERRNKYMETQLVKYNELQKEPSTPIDVDKYSMMDFNEDELKSKIDQLKQKLNKFKSSSISNQVESKIAQSELSLMNQKLKMVLEFPSQPYPQSTIDSINYLYQTKKVSLFCHSLLDILRQHDEGYSKSITIKAMFDFMSVSNVLDSIATKLECDSNFAWTEYYPVINNSEMYIKQATEDLKRGDIPSDIDFDSLRIELLEISLKSAVFENRESLMLGLTDLKSCTDISLTLILGIQKFLSKYDSGNLQSVSSSIRNYETALRSLEDSVRKKLKSCEISRQKFQDIEYIEEISMLDNDRSFKVLHKIYQDLENESNFIQLELDLDVLSDIFELDKETLSTSILEKLELEARELTTKVDLISITSIDIPTKKVFEHFQVSENGEHDVKTKEIELMKEKMVSWASKFKEKDRLIEELNLKITLLQNKLTLNEVREEQVSELKSQISELIYQNSKLKENYVILEEQYNDNQDKLQEFAKSNKVIGNFEDIYEQKEFNSKATLISEIYLLRSMVKNQTKATAYDQELEWLDKEISQSFKMETKNTIVDEFRKCSNNLRKYAKTLQIIPIKNPDIGGSSWRPRESIPRFYVSILKEEFGKYTSEKHALSAQ